MAEPSVNNISAPNNTKKIMIGANHHFLLTLRKSQNSESIESLLIFIPFRSYRLFNTVTNIFTK